MLGSSISIKCSNSVELLQLAAAKKHCANPPLTPPTYNLASAPRD